MKRTKQKASSLTVAEAKKYLLSEGFVPLTKKQVETDEWKQSIDAARQLINR